MSYLCPACKSELLWGGRAIYQTTSEHVTHPNHEPPYRSFYYCANEKCDANAPEESLKRQVIVEKNTPTDPDSIETFWDEDGELYGDRFNIKFIDNNYGPFGSEARRMNVEIYKKDENKTIIKLFGLRIDVEYKYKADTEGRILSKKRNFQFWKKSGIGYTYVSKPFSKLWYYNRQFKNNIDNFIENDSVYSGRNLEKLFNPRKNPFDIRRINLSAKAFSLYLKLAYPRVNKKLKDKKYINDF